MRKTLFVCVLAAIFLVACKHPSEKKAQANETTSLATGTLLHDSIIVYQSDHLIIQQLSGHIYQHISFLNTTDFGKVSCNGMVVVDQNEAVVFDTPAGDTSSAELIDFLTIRNHYKIKAIIPTHFHEDCVAGLEKFNENNIPSYASNKTIALLKNKGRLFSKPLHGFDDSLVLNVADKKVYIAFFGEGHTKDNIVGYFPEDKAVFGGCLIKEVGAGKGNLADANVVAWPGTVSKLKQTYPGAMIVIPGHGKNGGTELFDYTIQLFK